MTRGYPRSPSRLRLSVRPSLSGCSRSFELRGRTMPPLPAPPTADLREFEAAYRAHFAFAWRSLRRLGVPERDLPDATQEVFLVVHKKLPDFDARSRLSTWVYAICLRVASDRRRRASN